MLKVVVEKAQTAVRHSKDISMSWPWVFKVLIISNKAALQVYYLNLNLSHTCDGSPQGS